MTNETLRSAVRYHQLSIIEAFESKLGRPMSASERAPIETQFSLMMLEAIGRDVDARGTHAEVAGYLNELMGLHEASQYREVPETPPSPTFWKRVGSLFADIFA